MANVHEVIGDDLRAFIERQALFFVATAPRSDTARNSRSSGEPQGSGVLDLGFEA